MRYFPPTIPPTITKVGELRQICHRTPRSDSRQFALRLADLVRNRALSPEPE
jgi:hypothetical protein